MNTENPFAAPKANLQRPEELVPAPRTVRWAVVVIALAIVLQLLWILAMWAGLMSSRFPEAARMQAALNSLIGGLIFAWLAWKIHTRRNWARWVFTVWIGLGVVGLGITMLLVPAAWRPLSVADWIASVMQTAVNVAAVVLLFTRTAREWFAR
jgi:hypothetical protein